MVYPLIIGNICAKFDQNSFNSLISIVFIRLCLLLSIVILTFKINMVYPLIINIMSDKFGEDMHNRGVTIQKKRIAIFFHCIAIYSFPYIFTKIKLTSQYASYFCILHNRIRIINMHT